jgi:hypothetical protein
MIMRVNVSALISFQSIPSTGTAGKPAESMNLSA